MIRFFLKVMVGIIALLIILFMSLMVLKPQLDRQLRAWVKETQGKSFEILFFDYGQSRFDGANLILAGVRAKGISRIQHPYFEPREFEMKTDEVRIGVNHISRDGVEVQIHISGFAAHGGQLLNEDSDDQERLESVSKLNLQTSFFLKGSPFSWKEQVMKEAQVYRSWVFNDQAIRGLQMSGKAVFMVDGWPISVRFFSVQNEAGEVHLEGNPEDLRVIAEMIEPKFTEADLYLAAKNLVKMPKLLHIRREAEMRAVKLDKRDPEITYDTFRHIFWSYWLTKAYGAEFARETTNAHEIGDITNSPEESDKDRHHNALGVEYAEKGLSEEDVEKIIFEEPRIVRKPVKVPRKPKPSEPVKGASEQEDAPTVVLP